MGLIVAVDAQASTAASAPVTVIRSHGGAIPALRPDQRVIYLFSYNPLNSNPMVPPTVAQIPDWVEHWEHELTKIDKSKIYAYEIWNEPNLPQFWQGRASNPKHAARLYNAMKAMLRRVDPTKPVMGGSIIDGEYADITFQDYTKRYLAECSPDMLSVHSYFDVGVALNFFVKQHRRIALTEYGIPLANEVTEARRVSYYKNAAKHIKLHKRVEVACAYSWDGNEYRIADAAGTPMPSGKAFLEGFRTP